MDELEVDDDTEDEGEAGDPLAPPTGTGTGTGGEGPAPPTMGTPPTASTFMPLALGSTLEEVEVAVEESEEAPTEPVALA